MVFALDQCDFEAQNAILDKPWLENAFKTEHLRFCIFRFFHCEVPM